MGDGVFVANASGQVVLMNPAAARMTGPVTPGNETVQERARLPWFFREDGITPFRPKDFQLYRSVRGDSADDEVVFIRRPDKPEIWVSGTSRPLSRRKRRNSGAVLVVATSRNDAATNPPFARPTCSSSRPMRRFARAKATTRNLPNRICGWREVEHRVRNNLAGLLALISVMRDQASDVKSFADSMESRLSAMLHVHQLLAQAGWTRIGLRELIDGALATLDHMAPYPAVTHIDGPEVSIGPTAGLAADACAGRMVHQ